jgi:hypothetical protein
MDLDGFMFAVSYLVDIESCVMTSILIRHSPRGGKHFLFGSTKLKQFERNSMVCAVCTLACVVIVPASQRDHRVRVGCDKRCLHKSRAKEERKSHTDGGDKKMYFHLAMHYLETTELCDPLVTSHSASSADAAEGNER